jgi:uncharacterized membrane protein YjdF
MDKFYYIKGWKNSEKLSTGQGDMRDAQWDMLLTLAGTMMFFICCPVFHFLKGQSHVFLQ